MANYKERVCLLCKNPYTPTSPKQKYCKVCKEEGRRIADRKRDRKRSRERFGYKKYTKKCKVCGEKFITYYSSKLYCGSSECESERVRLKNIRTHLNRDHKYMIEKGRRYYKENRNKCCRVSATMYRKNRPNAKKYVPGRPYKHTLKYISVYVETRGYKLLSDTYINSKEPIVLMCPEGHVWETTFHNFRDVGKVSGARCLRCYLNNNYISKFELSVRDFVGTIYNGKVVYNDRTVIKNPNTNRFLELDLYFPQLNRAIECDGLYWHSNEDSVYRDTIKDIVCKDAGVELLRVNDHEWSKCSTMETIREFLINY